MVLEDFPNLTRKFNKFVIGLSGGQDSVAVLHLLQKLKLNGIGLSEFSVEAVHVNHGLQKEASEFQHFCEKLCSKLKIKLHVEIVSITEAEIKKIGEEALRFIYSRSLAERFSVLIIEEKKLLAIMLIAR